MGTNNFHYVNTSMCFAVLMTDDEGNSPEQWEWDDVQYEMIELFKETFSHVHRGGTDNHELRSFPSRCVVQGMCPVTGNWITAVLRSGYYDGACWDWDIEDDEAVSQETIDKVEVLFGRVSMKLVRVGSFSNGETLYNKVD